MHYVMSVRYAGKMSSSFLVSGTTCKAVRWPIQNLSSSHHADVIDAPPHATLAYSCYSCILMLLLHTHATLAYSCYSCILMLFR